MHHRPNTRLEDWVRLILFDWAVIYFLLFYSILVGVAAGGMAAHILGGITGAVRLFRLYPAGSGTLWMLGCGVAAVFLMAVRAVRYDSAGGDYRVEAPWPAIRLLIRRAGIGLSVLLVSALF